MDMPMIIAFLRMLPLRGRRASLVVLLFLFLLVSSCSATTTTSSFHHHHDDADIYISAPPPPPLRRELPEKVIVGYASECDEKVVTAVKQGVNVVIWAFYHLSPTTAAAIDDEENQLEDLQKALDLKCIQDMMDDLDQQGYTDTVHLVSMGGWNGPHLDPYYQSAAEWFDAFVNSGIGNIFHGIDIDFEGDDDLTSDLNYLSVAELDRMGEIMKLAKQSGYIIFIVPAQSYLDIQSTRFSRYLNLTDPDRLWHKDFSYFGRNLYAYWLAKYGEFIDLVMIQFYESYSRAAMEITQNNHQTPENYLAQYVWDLNQPQQGPGFVVNFESGDPTVGLPDNCYIPLPLSKLVWGFGNAWTNTPNNDRNYYFPPVTINAAYQNLWDWMLEPRGMMFWNIGNEGEQGIYYARGLNEILHIRNNNDYEEEEKGLPPVKVQ
jgi:hypothetical protein